MLVGYSMGGALALRLAAEWPPDRLVLIAPLWRLLGPAWPLGALLPLVQHFVPSIGLLDHGSALDNPELRQFFARAAPTSTLTAPRCAPSSVSTCGCRPRPSPSSGGCPSARVPRPAACVRQR